MSEVAVFAWYMLGALLHVAYRWAAWKGNNRDRSWGHYWKGHLAYNVQALILAVVLAFVWTHDLVGHAVAWVGLDPAKIPQVPHSPLSSIGAGFLFEYLGQAITRRLGRR